MTLATILTRLRIRNAADDADLLVVTSEAGGTNPYIEDREVSADGQSVDPLTGKVTVGDYVIPIIDVESASSQEVVVWQEDFGAYANDGAFTAVWTGDDDPENLVTFALSTEKVNPAAKSVKVTDTGNAASGSGIHGYRTRVVSGLDPGVTYHYYRRVYDTGRWPSLTDNTWSVVSGGDLVANGSGEVTIFIGWITAGAGAVDTDDHYEGDVWLTTDYPTNARVVTGILADTAGRLQVLGHRAYYEENVDAGGWDVLVAGYVTEVEFPDALRCAVHVGEAERIEQTTELFQTLDRSYTEPSCLLGGPVPGGFALVPDYGRPIFEVVAVSASTHVTLRYVTGPIPPSYSRTGGMLASIIRQGQASAILNAAALPLAVPSEDYTPGRLWTYPDLAVELYAIGDGAQVTVAGAQRGVAGLFTPISRLIGGFAAALIAQGFLEGAGRELVWNGFSFTIDWATSQPSVGARYSVLLYGLRISQLAPFHVSGHPVDIAEAIYTAFGIATDATTKAATRDALGDDLWVSLRPTAPTLAATVLQDWLFGPFGFATRVGVDGEREYFPTRYRTATDPSETITAADLQGVPADVWRVAESSICNKLVWTQEKYRGAAVPGEDADVSASADRALDGLEMAHYTIEVESAEDIAATVKPSTVTYAIPGQIGNPATGGLVEDVEAFVDALATDLFARYGRGNPEQALDCLRGVAAEVGDYAIVDLDHLPVPDPGNLPAMRRGGAKVVQVVQRTPATGGTRLLVRDAGPLVAGSPTPLTPTLSLAATAAYPKKQARVTVTNMSALDGTGYEVRIEYGVGASDPGTYQLLGYVTATGLTYRDTPLVNAGTKVWARARLVRAQGSVAQLGPYSSVGSVDLPDLTAPSALSVTAAGAGAATLTWTNGEATEPVVVEYQDQADSAWTRAAKLVPGTTTYLLAFPAAATDYDIRVYHEEAAPSSGQSAADTDTYTTGGTLDTLAAPTNPVGSGGEGTARLSVTAALGGTALAFEVAPETAVGAGTYGTYVRYALLVPANAGAVVAADLTAPRDGLRYALRARHEAEGFTPSAYTTVQVVDPWADVGPPDDGGGTTGPNMLLNGDAELKAIIGWRAAYLTGLWGRTTTSAVQGAWAWEVTGDGGTVLSDDFLPINAGQGYELSGAVQRVSATDGGTLTIGLACYDEDEALLDTYLPLLFDAVAVSGLATDWSYYRARVVGEDDVSNADDTKFRNGTRFVKVVLLPNAGATGTGTVLRLDDLALRWLDEPLYTLYGGEGQLGSGVTQAGTDGTGRTLVKGKQTGYTHHGAAVTFAPAFAEAPAVRMSGGLVYEPRDLWGSVLECDGLAVTAATAASPIAVTTASAHGLSTGALVSIYQHGATAPGLTGLVGLHAITVTGGSTFTLDGTSGSGTYVANSCWASQAVASFDATKATKDYLVPLDLTGSGFMARALLTQKLTVALTPRSANGGGLTAVTQGGAGIGGTDPVDLGANVPAWDDRYTVATTCYLEAEGKTTGGTATLTMALDTNDGGGWVERVQFTTEVVYDAGSVTDNGTPTIVRVLTVAGLGASDDVRLRVVGFSSTTLLLTSDWSCGIVATAGVTWDTSSGSVQYASKTPEGADEIYWEAEGYQ